MLDIKAIKENPEHIKRLLSKRSGDFSANIDRVVALDSERREIIYFSEQIKQRQNVANKEIPQLKKSGGDSSALFSLLKELSDQSKTYDARLRDVKSQLSDLLLQIPNTPSSNVPIGASSDDNPVTRLYGKPRNFDFEPKAHWDLGESLGILDPVRAAKVTGARFHFYKGAGAALERALINYFLDTHTRHNGYTEIFPPFLANKESMTSTGQLPKFQEDMFHVENTDYFLIPTAEVPVTNFHRDEILDQSEMPLKYAAYSACFRAEAGSAGRDTRGLIRQHQFNKVELVWFCEPEDSYNALEKLISHAESVLQGLGLPYRVVALCGADLGFSSAFTYDIEAWMPSYGRYTEISSCSNFEGYQARRASIRYKDSSDKSSKPRYVHTLNGSGVAIGRTVACVLENYQNADGTITIPEVLRPYMGGADNLGRYSVRRMLRHCGTVEILSPRLIMRKLELSDAESMHRNWASSVEVYKYMTSSRMVDLDDVRYFIKKKLSAYTSPDCYYWGLVLPDTGEVIGMTTVTEISNAQRNGNIAYALGTAWWGMGYAREAVEQVFKLMFGPVGIKKMYGCHFSENVRSGNVLKAVGMKHTGRNKEPIYHMGRYLYCENYELTSGSYHNRQLLTTENTQPEIY